MALCPARLNRYSSWAELSTKGSADPLPPKVAVTYGFQCGGGPALPGEAPQNRIERPKDTVEITPQDVQQKKFDTSKRGFDTQQVGVFLDQMAAALASRDRELHECKTEIEALNRAVANVRENEEAFRLTMTAATQAKEEMLRRAAEEAKRIEAAAREAAELISDRAAIDAEDAAASLRREVAGLREERAALEAKITDLTASAQTVRNSLDELGAVHEETARPALELVVDRKPDTQRERGDGLAARVGDLRG